LPLAWAAKVQAVPAASVWPLASVKVQVMAEAVLLLAWSTWPPSVLNWPLKLTPAVRWMTIVTVSEVSGGGVGQPDFLVVEERGVRADHGASPSSRRRLVVGVGLGVAVGVGVGSRASRSAWGSASRRRPGRRSGWCWPPGWDVVGDPLLARGVDLDGAGRVGVGGVGPARLGAVGPRRASGSPPARSSTS